MLRIAKNRPADLAPHRKCGTQMGDQKGEKSLPSLQNSAHREPLNRPMESPPDRSPPLTSCTCPALCPCARMPANQPAPVYPTPGPRATPTETETDKRCVSHLVPQRADHTATAHRVAEPTADSAQPHPSACATARTPIQPTLGGTTACKIVQPSAHRSIRHIDTPERKTATERTTQHPTSFDFTRMFSDLPAPATQPGQYQF